jgi:hypothetical protein
VFLGTGVHRSLVPVHVAHLRRALALVMGQGRMVARYYEANNMPYGSEVQGLSAWLRSDNANGCVSMLLATMIEDVNSTQASTQPQGPNNEPSSRVRLTRRSNGVRGTQTS